MDRMLLVIEAVLGVPLALAAYIIGAELAVRRLSAQLQPRVRPWVWLGPAVFMVSVFLLFPMLETFIYSFTDYRHLIFHGFNGLDNYQWAASSDDVKAAVYNNVLWLVLMPLAVIAFATVIAVLADRVRYEVLIKSVVFMPMALSTVAASLIWSFVYNYDAPSDPQRGVLNAIVTIFHPPIAWLSTYPFDNYALIAIMVWMWMGYAMVILSAALKGIPGELLEAARSDGATEPQIFWRIILPLLQPTMIVLATTLVIQGLKAFDIVYVLTNGREHTDVIANQVYSQFYESQNIGRASALSVLLLVATLPVMYFNLRRIKLHGGRS